MGDRHINLADKEKYLKNIKRNLGRGGLLIVGDEFLPPHNEGDNYARQTAVEIYHQHCLTTARQKQNSGLISALVI
ncbi:MAG: hypothetical protein QNJ53_10535 [Pleurocapsa sp. MO_192.B19]|nr:hypothetical protein [Pleurocapsa sp. MO_192.B19]